MDVQWTIQDTIKDIEEFIGKPEDEITEEDIEVAVREIMGGAPAFDGMNEYWIQQAETQIIKETEEDQ